ALADAPGEPVTALLVRCHEEMRGTRGAVMTLVSFRDDDTLTWVGVGNVEALLLRAGGGARESIVLRGGVVGYEIPPLRPITYAVAAGDTLVMATDGIRGSFGDQLRAEASPGELAEQILREHGKHNHDALVLVARYVGGRA